MKPLLTAFEPFEGSKENAAWEAAKLPPERMEATSVVCCRRSYRCSLMERFYCRIV